MRLNPPAKKDVDPEAMVSFFSFHLYLIYFRVWFGLFLLMPSLHI